MDYKNKSEKKTKGGRIRRARSDAGERNFICGCSKTYLSYPALYTHVKNKHDGTFPEGSILKTIDKKPEEEVEDYLTAEKLSYRNEVRGFLRRLEGAYSDKAKMTRKDMMKYFPLDSFKDDSIAGPLHIALTSILSKDGDKEVGRVGNFSNLVGKMSCDNVLSYFAIDFAANITPEFCKEFLVFLCFLRKAYNEHGQNLKRNSSKAVYEPKVSYAFCLGTDLFHLPRIANIFLQELFPVYFNEVKNKKKFKFIGIKDNQLINVVFLLKFVCNWLLIHDFTILKLEINTDP